MQELHVLVRSVDSLHSQVHHLGIPYLVTVRRSIREDVLKMESTLLHQTVPIPNHSKYFVTWKMDNVSCSREEDMLNWTSIATGPIMKKDLEIHSTNIGLDWRRSTAWHSVFVLPRWELTWSTTKEYTNMPSTAPLLFTILPTSTD